MPHQHLVDQFKQFREECIWLRICYNTHLTLFSNANKQVIDKTAPTFFTDINRVLGEYIFLRVCVLTDPAKTGKDENLSSNAINSSLENYGLMTSRILELSGELEKYRVIALKPRNKLISHLDRAAVLNGAALGTHTEEEMHAFYENLQEYCDQVGTALGVGPLDFRVTGCKGDAADLLQQLKKCVGS